MEGTEIARITGGRHSTSMVLTAQLTSQSQSENKSYFTLRGYIVYTGGTNTGSDYRSLYITGTEVSTGSYRVYANPGYLLLGTKTTSVTHNNDGTFPGSSQGIGMSSYHFPNGGEAWGNLSDLNVPTINRQANVTGATNFNDEGNPKITYSNPGGFRINARLEFGGTSIRRDNISNTGSYTFNLTESERTLLRQKCTGNSMTVREVIATCTSGSTESFLSWQDKTMTMVNANPTFSNFTFEDTNETTLALTGNNQDIIKNYSNVRVTIPVVDKAVAIKEATMSKYRFTCGDKTSADTMTYSSTDPVIGNISAVPNGTFVVYATDSRTNSTSVTKLANNVIEYTPLNKGNIDVVRANGVSELTTLTLTGNIDLVDFGDVVNSIKTAKYRYKIAGTSWTGSETYTDITLTIDSSGNFSFNDLIDGDDGVDGFSINNSYDIEVLIEDELSSITYTDTLNSGIPTLALAKNGVCIMGKYNDNVGGDFQIRGQKVLRPYVLYENSSGTTGTVTLSDSVANYDFIEIFVLSTSDAGTGYAQNSTKVWQPNGKTAWLTTGYCSTDNYNIKLTSALLSGTQITKPYGYWEFYNGGNSKTNYVGITKVIGYK